MKEYSEDEVITLTRQVAAGKLAATITHKAKNVLMPITGYVELMETGSLSAPKIKDYFKKIEKAGHNLQLLLKKYLRFSRPPLEMREEEIVLQESIEDVLDLFEHQLVAAKLKVERKVIPAELRVAANYDDLSLILASLFFNAIEAAPAGGKISLALDQAKNAVRISISDDGPGVKKDIRDKIFEPFFTTKNGSLGLGLTASLFLSRRLNGKLSLKDKNEFILSLRPRR